MVQVCGGVGGSLPGIKFGRTVASCPFRLRRLTRTLLLFQCPVHPDSASVGPSNDDSRQDLSTP